MQGLLKSLMANHNSSSTTIQHLSFKADSSETTSSLEECSLMMNLMGDFLTDYPLETLHVDASGSSLDAITSILTRAFLSGGSLKQLELTFEETKTDSVPKQLLQKEGKELIRTSLQDCNFTLEQLKIQRLWENNTVSSDILFYLDLNKGGKRHRLLKGEGISREQWLEDVICSTNDNDRNDEFNLSSVFYYLRAKPWMLFS
jgi:hypothetical protein